LKQTIEPNLKWSSQSFNFKEQNMNKLQSLAGMLLMGWGLHAYAEAPAPNSLPKEEKAFVDAIGKLKKAEIVALLGEPAKAEDVKLKDSGRVVASIWHYHFINQSATTGEMYPTTELDFIDDNVNVVVFLNNDGSEKSVAPSEAEPAKPDGSAI
jgi:hypothetical protein